MRASVIIPVFNERDSLPLVVGDIPAGLVAEVVVVDNGSTDGTDRIARGLPVRLVHEQELEGEAAVEDLDDAAVERAQVLLLVAHRRHERELRRACARRGRNRRGCGGLAHVGEPARDDTAAGKAGVPGATAAADATDTAPMTGVPDAAQACGGAASTGRHQSSAASA